MSKEGFPLREKLPVPSKEQTRGTKVGTGDLNDHTTLLTALTGYRGHGETCKFEGVAMQPMFAANSVDL